MFTQITLGNILFYLSIFHLHPDCNSEYSVLPHIIPSKIIPWPRLLERIFRLSSVYSIFTQIILGNILSYPIFILQILFLAPVYSFKYFSSAPLSTIYSVLAQYILCSPRLHSGIFCLTTYYSFKYYSLAKIIGENIPS